MTPWVRERLIEFVRASAVYTRAGAALTIAEASIKSEVRSMPLVVLVDGKTYVVSRDDDSAIIVQEAEA